MAANVIVDTTDNRPYWHDGSGSYGSINLTEVEAHIIEPSEFLIMRPGDTLLRCFPKGQINQISFQGTKEEIDSVYSDLLGGS